MGAPMKKSAKEIKESLESTGTVSVIVMIACFLVFAGSVVACWESGGWSSMSTVECGGSECGLLVAAILVFPLSVSFVVAIGCSIIGKVFDE